jgi:septal ring factor EnvC (AmiA/AmiB activator)
MPWYSDFFNEYDHNIFDDKKKIVFAGENYLAIIGEIKSVSESKSHIVAEQKRMTQQKMDLDKKKIKYLKTQKEQLELIRQIEYDKKIKKKELKKMQQKKEKLKILVSSLKNKVKNMERLIQAGKDFEASKGVLPWPVDGKIVSRYGKQNHPKLDAVVFNRGISISPKNPNMAVIRAVSMGEVVYSGKFEGLDNIVVIDHGNDYYTLYGKIKELLVSNGAEVSVGADLGSINSNEMYFELGRGSKAQDPLIWLSNIDNK